MNKNGFFPGCLIWVAIIILVLAAFLYVGSLDNLVREGMEIGGQVTW